MTQLVHEILSPLVMLVVFREKSPDPAPTVPSNMVAGVLVVTRKTAAVPLVSALASSGIAEAVATPEAAAPNAGSLNVKVPSFAANAAVCTSSNPAPAPPSIASTNASHMLVLIVVAILLIAMVSIPPVVIQSVSQ
jgi:hypothetical protein